MDNFMIIFNNEEEEKLFYTKINKIVVHMQELANDGCLLPENAIAELQYICSNRNIANFSEIALMEEIRYEIKDIINTFNLDHIQIKNLSKYISTNIYKI